MRFRIEIGQKKPDLIFLMTAIEAKYPSNDLWALIQIMYVLVCARKIVSVCRYLQLFLFMGFIKFSY